MKWVTYRTSTGERAGLVVDDTIHGLDNETTVLDLLGDDGERMHDAAARATSAPIEIVDLGTADLAPPLRPRQIRDYLCFLDHLRNILAAYNAEPDPTAYEVPGAYFSCISTLLGPNDDVCISPGSTRFDFELEVAAVIGKGGSDIAPEDAMSHIAGFMIFCDWTARDVQMREMALGLGAYKGKDGANTLGPMFVTSDELEQHRSGGSYDLQMTAYVNDELVGGGSMAQMDWQWADVVTHASRGSVLLPGDILGSGTVPTGSLVELASTQGEAFRGFLQPGDVVRLEVDQLGEIRQRVLSSVPAHPMRTLRDSQSAVLGDDHGIETERGS